MTDVTGTQLSAEQEQIFAMYVTVAQVAHQVNRAYCQAIGDDSMVDWANAPSWQVQSAIDGVTFHLANPDCTPEQSHKNWMAQKTRDGWVYGAVKNPDIKMHPCMVPYDQLPVEQRAKDYLFKAVCEEFAQIFGMREVAEEQEQITVAKVELPPLVEAPEPSRIILL